MSGSPARRAVGAFPPPSGRRFPCASIRARRRARDAIVYRSLWLAGNWSSRASNLGKPHRGASGQRQSLRGSPWAIAGRRPAMRAGAVQARSGVGSATVHGRTRVRHKPSHTGRSIPRRARVPTRPDPVPCRFPTRRNHVGLLSEIHVGQEVARAISDTTTTRADVASWG